MAKSDQHEVKVTGPGLSFERPVSEEVANRIINLIMAGAASTSLPSGVPASDVNTSIIGSGAPTNETTPKQFIAQKRPANNYERVTCLAYYLTNHRNSPQFKTADIKNLGTEAGVHLSNPAVFVGHATNTYRYLMAAGGGRKQLTALGEAVVEALPDQEKVKAALAEHKSSRRKKRRAKRK